MSTGNFSPGRGLAFPVQYRASRGGPPVRYSYQNYEDWCGLAVLYCQYSPALNTVNTTQLPEQMVHPVEYFQSLTEISPFQLFATMSLLDFT